jgi:serine/threonine-protein kinase
VALKFLLPEALSNKEAVERFSREARAAVKIKSEHVARVTDVGTLESGSPYMVMEYLRGYDLGEVLAQKGPLPIAEVVEYVLQACEALAEAHALGIVHRDLKPANLFLTQRADGSPSVKVLDFGISKVTTGVDSKMDMTRTAMTMGSPLYMSPEQMASAKDVDARTDLWAVGVILFQLLAGKAPFDADSMPELCAKILQEGPPVLRNLRADAPEGLQAVVQKCLQKKRDDRYPTVSELATELLPFGPPRCRVSVERIARVMQNAGLSESRPSSMSPSELAAFAASVGTQGAWEQASSRRSSGGRLFLFGGIFVAALAALGVFLAKSSAESAVEATTPSATSAPPVVAAVASSPTALVQPTAPSQPTAVAQPAALAEPTASPATALTPPAPSSQLKSQPRPAPPRPVQPARKPPNVRPSPTSPKLPQVDLNQDRK